MAKKNSKQTTLRNKWLLIGVVFVILFVIFYTALPKQTITPTQTTNNSSSETAGWKTFQENSYLFKYPNGFYVNDYGSPKSVTVLNYQQTDGGTLQKGDYSMVVQESQDQAYSVDSLNPMLAQNDQTQSIKVDGQSIMKTNGFDVIYKEISYKDPLGNSYSLPEAYILDGKGRVVLITGLDNTRPDLFKEFVSTFKFTK